jgi:hypothetical protein
MEKEVAIRKLMQACEMDPALSARLLANPDDVAKEFEVKLEPEEVAQLQRVKKLQDLVAEFTQGRGIGRPIGYPVDVMWKTTIANHLQSYRPIYYPIFYQIFYPYRPPIYYPVAGYPAGPIEFEGIRRSGARRRT